MNQYALCEFEYGYSGTFYQVTNNGNFVGLFDMDGNPLILTENHGYSIINPNPEIPSWAN